MKHTAKIVGLVILAVTQSFAQSKPTAQQADNCSINSAGNNNQIVIDCKGIGKEQGQKILSLLNRMLAKGVDTNAVLAQILDKENEIISNQEKQSEAIGKIKGQQGPWVLNTLTQQKIFDILSNIHTPRVPILVEAQTQSAQRIQQTLTEMLMRLQWPHKMRVTTESSAPPIIGIDCFGTEKVSNAIPKIEAALQLVNPEIQCRTVSERDIRNPEDRVFVNIIIGERP